MTNLTSIFIFSYVSNANIADVSALHLLTSYTTYFYYGGGVLPSMAGLTNLQTLTIFVGYSQPSGSVVIPSNMFDGLTLLTSLYISTAGKSYGGMPDFANNTGLTAISLSNNGLEDSDFEGKNFGVFTSLSTLELSSNSLLSKLPDGLSTITTLRTINVNYCNMTRADSFFDMRNTRLTSFSVGYNGMTTFPSQLCQLSTLWATYGNVSVNLAGNYYTSIPSCFFTQGINSLTLGDTKITSFPTGVMDLYLNYFYWYGNDVPMTLSSWNLNAWKDKMHVFHLESTHLTAPFPSGMRDFPTLYSFYASENRFTTPIPDDFFINGIISEFSVPYCGLTGAFPSSVGRAALSYIEAYGNQFTSIPDSIGQIVDLYYIDFSDNALNSIPSNNIWANLTNMEYVYIGGNRHLYSQLPQAWFNDPMNTLNATYCSFYGDHPAINSSALSYIYLTNNLLDGTIKAPEKMSYLYYWFADQNGLTGSLPANLGEASSGISWTYFYQFNVSFNRLTGTLPAGLNNLGNLQLLGLNNNGFHGALPYFDQLSNVYQFDGSTNFFNICTSDPHFSSGSLGTDYCNVKQNLYPGACSCPEFVDSYCQADTECPAPGFIPVSIPLGDAPTPVRPPSHGAPQTAATPTSTGDSSQNLPSVISSLLVLLLVALIALHT
jgi:Leucine-rich repeat (LRR) protein